MHLFANRNYTFLALGILHKQQKRFAPITNNGNDMMRTWPITRSNTALTIYEKSRGDKGAQPTQQEGSILSPMHRISSSMAKMDPNHYTVERSRLWRIRNKGLFFTKRIEYGREGRSYGRTQKRLLKSCCTIIHKKYFHDDLKSPMNNRPKSAMFARPSLNIYFGVNKKMNNNKQSVTRTSYGMGSGKSTIGLNPRTMRVYNMFDELTELRRHAERSVRDDGQWNDAMKNRSFNFCSVKVYYSCADNGGKVINKSTKWHTDVTTDDKGNPNADNSQVPGTPVAILTFGDEKDLWFRRRSKNKKKPEENSDFNFRQRSNSFVVLDGRDEEPTHDGMYWEHKSEMAGKETGRVTFSFMFRVVQVDIKVHPTKHTMVAPRITAVKDRWFREAEAAGGLMSGAAYEKARKDLDCNIADVLSNY